MKKSLARGQRGKSLERTFVKLLDFYDTKGIHTQQNHPEKLADGTCIKNHGFDFQVFHQGTFYAFDAKMCNSKTLAIQNLKPHQIRALSQVEQQGGEGFFVIFFVEENKMIRLSAKESRDLLADGKRSVSSNDGTQMLNINFLEIK